MLSQKEVKPLLLCLINLDSRFSQAAKTEEVYLHQTCLFKEPSQDVSMNCSCSQVVSPEMLASNGFLTHSDFDTDGFKIQFKLVLKNVYQMGSF